MNKYMGLCHRCEHRVKYIEDYEKEKQKLIAEGRRNEIESLFVHRPRCECGGGSAVHSCYMYQPVKPLIIEKNEGDERPMLAAPMISARCHAVKIHEGVLGARVIDDALLLYWTPEISNKDKTLKLKENGGE